MFSVSEKWLKDNRNSSVDKNPTKSKICCRKIFKFFRCLDFSSSDYFALDKIHFEGFSDCPQGNWGPTFFILLAACLKRTWHEFVGTFIFCLDSNLQEGACYFTFF